MIESFFKCKNLLLLSVGSVQNGSLSFLHCLLASIASVLLWLSDGWYYIPKASQSLGISGIRQFNVVQWKNISLSTPLNTRHFHFPFLQSTHLYTRAEGSQSKAHTWSKTPHLTKVNVSRVRHPVGECDNCWENKSSTKFNIRVWGAGLRSLTSCIRPLCRSLPMSDQGFLTVVLRKAEHLFARLLFSPREGELLTAKSSVLKLFFVYAPLVDMWKIVLNYSCWFWNIIKNLEINSSMK